MANNARFAEVASLAGDPARVGMLHALMDGRAFTTSELAAVAGDTAQTACQHLARFAGHGKTARVLCRPCLDWSERKPHLAGAVGAALCTRSLEQGWIRRIEGTRAVTVTPKGQRVFGEAIGVRFKILGRTPLKISS